MSEFSKAPWRVAQDSWHTFDIRGFEGDYIAEVMTGLCGETDDSEQDWQWINQQKANAQLMASAPDLLEALIDLLDYAESGWDHFPDCAIVAKNAIAKATTIQ